VRMEHALRTQVCGIIGKGGARSSRTEACAGKVRKAAHLRGTLLISPHGRAASAWRYLEWRPSDETGEGWWRAGGFRALVTINLTLHDLQAKVDVVMAVGQCGREYQAYSGPKK